MILTASGLFAADVVVPLEWRNAPAQRPIRDQGVRRGVSDLNIFAAHMIGLCGLGRLRITHDQEVGGD